MAGTTVRKGGSEPGLFILAGKALFRLTYRSNYAEGKPTLSLSLLCKMERTNLRFHQRARLNWFVGRLPYA